MPPGSYYRPGVYLRPVTSVRGNTVYVLNILRWFALSENVHGFYSYYRTVGVTLSGAGEAPVGLTSRMTHYK